MLAAVVCCTAGCAPVQYSVAKSTAFSAKDTADQARQRAENALGEGDFDRARSNAEQACSQAQTVLASYADRGPVSMTESEFVELNDKTRAALPDYCDDLMARIKSAERKAGGAPAAAASEAEAQPQAASSSHAQAVAPDAVVAAPQPGAYALVVGIDRYRDAPAASRSAGGR